MKKIIVSVLVTLTGCGDGYDVLYPLNCFSVNSGGYDFYNDASEYEPLDFILNEYEPCDNQEDVLTIPIAYIETEERYCGTDFAETVSISDSNSTAPPIIEALWLPFEHTLSEFTTDVVMVQYVESRPFGQFMTEFEFVVTERILGNAADRIFVYAEFAGDNRLAATSAQIGGLGITFNHESTYLLPLIMIADPHANTHDDGFVFIQYAVFDLDNPLNSVILGRPLSQQSFSSLNIHDNISKYEIVSFVTELTRDNPPARDIISYDVIEDIIIGSPYVLVVEINRPLRLSGEQHNTDFGATDLYYVTALQTLKGDFIEPDGFLVIFSADTVFPGERHIVAIEPITEGSSWFRFTSRNSLFTMEQLEYIMQIIIRSKVYD